MQIDPQEFERLALAQLDMLYRIACRLTRDPVRAEDLVQETYLRAFRGRKGFQLESFGMRPWLVRILQNLHFSNSARRSREPDSMDDSHLELAGAGATPPLWTGALFDGMDERLVHALDELPEEYRLVLLLWALDEMSYKEIADACDIPIGTVMSRLHRARQKLAQRLGKFNPNDDGRRE